MLVDVVSSSGQHVSSQLAGPLGQAQVLQTDGLGWLFFALAVLVCSLLIPTLTGAARVISFFLLMVVFVVSTYLLVSTNNLIGFLFLWELTAMSAWGVGKLGLRGGNPVLGALPVNAVGSLSFIAMFAFITLLVIHSGSLEMGDIKTTTPSLLMALLLIAILLKVFGLLSNAWFEGNEVAFPVSNALLASAGVAVVGVYPFVRFAGEFVLLSHDAQSLAIWTSLAIALVFALATLRELDLYRIASLLTFSQFCLVVAAASVVNQQAISGSLFAVIANALAAIILFLSIGVVCESTSARRLSDLGGLARLRPALAFVFLVAVLAASGIPPFGTFVGKIATSFVVFGYPDPLAGAVWVAAWSAIVLSLFRVLTAVLFPTSSAVALERVNVFPMIPIAAGSALLLIAALSPDLVIWLLQPAVWRSFG